jgi:Zn-dependent peptidase ImmA (M78 family)
VAVIVNTGDTSTLAHEIGHILLNSGAHPSGSIMQPRPRPNEITDPQCKTIYTNA